MGRVRAAWLGSEGCAALWRSTLTPHSPHPPVRAATKPFVRADATLRKSSVPKRPAPGATGGATATGGAGARPPKDFLTENAITGASRCFQRAVLCCVALLWRCCCWHGRVTPPPPPLPHAAILASPRTKPPRGIPNALLRPGFAQRPKYLDRVAREMAAEREYVLDLLDAQQQAARASSGVGAAAREMSDDERAELLAALKAKWTEVSTRLGVRAHRKISTSGSTVGEIRSKENGERMLARLEADIKRLSVPSPIYVTDA